MLRYCSGGPTGLKRLIPSCSLKSGATPVDLARMSGAIDAKLDVVVFLANSNFASGCQPWLGRPASGSPKTCVLKILLPGASLVLLPVLSFRLAEPGGSLVPSACLVLPSVFGTKLPARTWQSSPVFATQVVWVDDLARRTLAVTCVVVVVLCRRSSVPSWAS